MRNSLVCDKAYNFSILIVRFSYCLSSVKHEFVLSKQLLKSGTSICANIDEGLYGQSRKDFIHKLSIAYKEAVETMYWLNLIKDSGVIDYSENDYAELKLLLTEILKLLTVIIKTSKTSK